MVIKKARICDKLPWRLVCLVRNINEFSTEPKARQASVVATLTFKLFFYYLENHTVWNNIAIPFSIELALPLSRIKTADRVFAIRVCFMLAAFNCVR